jgi:hypothetical protein
MTYNGVKKIWIFVLELAMMCEKVKEHNCQALQLANTNLMILLTMLSKSMMALRGDLSIRCKLQ